MATIEYTTITPRGGGLIHATTIHDPYFTVCGIEWRGWLIAPKKLTCKACEEALERTVSAGVKRGRGKR
jgi:hypothetical protein